jgi:hypothetical protein
MAATLSAALQTSAVAVAAVLNGSPAVATATGHAAPQCIRLGSQMGTETVPVIVFDVTNARERGGLSGSFLVDVELYAVAPTMPAATALLTVVEDALTALAFAAVGLDAVPDRSGGADADPLDKHDIPYSECHGVATTFTLAIYLTT